jgi:hypothetical protein
MLLYFLLFPLSILVSLLCYVTNPIVLLFCNEAGELPRLLKYWQTWDDSCNPSDIKNFVPKFLLFDWDKHYEEYRSTTPELELLGRDRCYCRVINGDFTTKERIQRYFCRLLWLTRNCAYGWAFYVFGKTIEADSVEIVDQIDDEHGKKTFVRVKGKSKLFAPFLYKNDRDICSKMRWCNFFGWKIDYTSNKTHRAMLAGRIAVRFK